MEHNAQFLAEEVLKQKTKCILSEIKHLMEDEGVKPCLEDGLDEKNRAPRKRQFRLLMDAVGEASCVEEVVLFLSYQESKSGGWRKKCKNTSTIAKKVVDSFIKIINEIYPCMEEAFEAESMDGDERVLRLKILEKYVGYLYWAASAVIGEGEE